MKKILMAIVIVLISVVEALPVFATGHSLHENTDPQIPHLAQGHGWSTLLRLINLCEEAELHVGIQFYEEDGNLHEKGFVFEYEPTHPDALHNCQSSCQRLSTGKLLEPLEIRTYTMPDTGRELIQGSGQIVAVTTRGHGFDCLGMEVEYVQTLPNGETLRATIPIRPFNATRFKYPATGPHDWILSLIPNKEGCETGIAIASDPYWDSASFGFRVPTGVFIEARGVRGELLQRTQLGSIAHAAFPLHEKLPLIQAYDGIGTLRIIGARSAVALDFCNGKLEQFRLPIHDKAYRTTVGNGFMD